MAQLLIAVGLETGITTGKFVLRRVSDGAFWSTAGTPAFESYSAGNIANYGITATETGSTGTYTATNPSETTAAQFLFIKAAGASLAVSDLVSNVYYIGDAGPGSAAALASTGLDNISASVPNGVASTFVGKLMQTWARFFLRATKDADEIKTYRTDNTTVNTTQTYTSSGDDDDVGAAA